MCVFKLFVLIVFRVGTTNTPGVEVAVGALSHALELLCFKILVVLPTTPCSLLFRVGALEAPRMKMTVVVVLAVGVGLGQPHDGLGVGAHGGQRDLCVVRSRSLSSPASTPLTQYSGSISGTPQRTATA